MTGALIIAVVGGASCTPAESQLAESVGRQLAQADAILVCGGHGGVMAAACRGAKTLGGTTVGILPGDSVAEANRWVDIPIATGLGEARNAIVVRCAAAVIAIGGGYGTLSEIAMALKWGKSVVGLNTWDLAHQGAVDDSVVAASSASEAVRLALQSGSR